MKLLLKKLQEIDCIMIAPQILKLIIFNYLVAF